MSERLTEDWTDDAEGAFGEQGAIGDSGEIIAQRILESCGLNVEHHPSNRKKQLLGHDLTIESYGVDVKTNLYTGSDICVDADKIWSSKATFWFHLNDTNHEDYVMYKVVNVRNYIKENNISVSKTRGGPVYWVPRTLNEL